MSVIGNMMPLRSSYLHSTGYSPERQQAAIRFRGGLLRWYGISVQVWQQLISAPSPGRFFNQHVKNNPARALREPEPDTQGVYNAQ